MKHTNMPLYNNIPVNLPLYTGDFTSIVSRGDVAQRRRNFISLLYEVSSAGGHQAPLSELDQDHSILPLALQGWRLVTAAHFHEVFRSPDQYHHAECINKALVTLLYRMCDMARAPHGGMASAMLMIIVSEPSEYLYIRDLLLLRDKGTVLTRYSLHRTPIRWCLQPHRYVSFLPLHYAMEGPAESGDCTSTARHGRALLHARYRQPLKKTTRSSCIAKSHLRMLMSGQFRSMSGLRTCAKSTALSQQLNCNLNSASLYPFIHYCLELL